MTTLSRHTVIYDLVIIALNIEYYLHLSAQPTTHQNPKLIYIHNMPSVYVLITLPHKISLYSTCCIIVCKLGTISNMMEIITSNTNSKVPGNSDNNRWIFHTHTQYMFMYNIVIVGLIVELYTA